MRSPTKIVGGQGESYRIINDHTVLDDHGGYSCVLKVGLVDIDGVESSRRRQLIGAFTQLCNTVEGSLQILLRIRKSGSVRERASNELGVVISRFLEQRAAQIVSYQRDLFFVIRGDSESWVTQRCQVVKEVLTVAGVSANLLHDSGLNRLWEDWTSPVRDHPAYLELSDTFLKGVVVQRFPGTKVSAGWLAAAIRVNVDADLVINLHAVSPDDALAALRKRLRDHSSRQLIDAEREMLTNPVTDAAIGNILSLREGLASNEARAVKLSIVALARGINLKEAESAAQSIARVFRSLGCRAERTNLRHRAAFLSTAPAAIDALGEAKLVTAAAAATCIPWLSDTVVDSDGYHFGFDTAIGNQVAVNPFDVTQYSNANIGVFAASGQGKSFALSNIVLEGERHGVDSVIVDPEGEHQGLVASRSGNYLQFGDSAEVALNVLDKDLRSGDIEATLQTAVGFVDLLCEGRLTAVDRAHLDTILRRQILAKGKNLSHCLPDLRRVLPYVALVVERLCNGPYASTFCSTNQIDLRPSLVAIGLRGLPDEYVAPAALIVADFIWHTVITNPRPRHVVFDEVGALCIHPPLRALLIQLARRCRKYQASMVVATQNVSDLLHSGEANVIATNCATLLLGGHRAVEAMQMESAFGLSQHQRQFLESAPRGRFLLIAGNRRLPIEISIPQKYREWIEGRAGT